MYPVTPALGRRQLTWRDARWIGKILEQSGDALTSEMLIDVDG
jgi:hypothetical protein